MKATLQAHFGFHGDGCRSTARTEIEIAFTPSADIGISIAPWGDAKKPKRISYDVETETFDLFFGVEECDTKDQRHALAEDYRAFNWTVDEAG